MDSREGKYDSTLSKQARQDVPDPSLHNDGVYDATSVIKGRNDSDLLGETVAEESRMKDDGYPSVPTSGINGNSDVNYGAVAPYKYPEFGAWPGPKTRFVLGRVPD